MGKIAAHEKKLAAYCRQELAKIKGIRFHGPAKAESGIVSFNVGKIHAHDVSQLLDEDGIAIRSGHHCAQPLMGIIGEAATARASFYLYNTAEEADRLVQSIKRVQKRLG